MWPTDKQHETSYSIVVSQEDSSNKKPTTLADIAKNAQKVLSVFSAHFDRKWSRPNTPYYSKFDSSNQDLTLPREIDHRRKWKNLLQKNANTEEFEQNQAIYKKAKWNSSDEKRLFRWQILRKLIQKQPPQ